MTIVVGYITTKEGQAALEAAIAEARLRRAKLLIIHSRRGGRDLDAQEMAEAEAQLELVRASVEADGIGCEVRELVRGLEASEDLVQVAEEESATLIVIGLRRRTPVGKLILGSNAQRVLLDATCPVLAVKAAS
jgi:nucleotide-binding universal stress UspA family protein